MLDLDSDETYFRQRTRTYPSQAPSSSNSQLETHNVESPDISVLNQSMLSLSLRSSNSINFRQTSCQNSGNTISSLLLSAPSKFDSFIKAPHSPIHPISASFHSLSTSTNPLSPFRSAPTTPKIGRSLNINTSLANNFGSSSAFLPSPSSVDDSYISRLAFSPWASSTCSKSPLTSTLCSPEDPATKSVHDLSGLNT